MKLIRALLKPLSFLPALCLMYMIFSFSAQDGATSSALSYKVSYKIVETGAKVLGENLEPYQIDSLATRFHGIVRKLAHMTEYFALAITVAFPLYVYGLRGIWLMLVAGFICVAFACGDEYHQSFVANRSPSKRDVAIDSFGVFWGIVLVRIIGWTGRKTIFRPFSDEAMQKREEKKARKKQQKAAKKGQNPDYNQMNGHQPYPGTPQNGYPYQQPLQNGYPYQQPPQNGYPYQQPSQNGYPYQQPSQNGYPYQQPLQNGNPYHSPADSYAAPQNASYGTSPQCNYSSHPKIDDDDDDYVSDKLSEDMSFRKLMHDIKDQKQERNSL